MSDDAIQKFKTDYLDYVEGLTDEPPTTHGLTEKEQVVAQGFVASLEAARGVDPYASRPPVEDLMARTETAVNEYANTEIAVRLEAQLRQTFEGAMVVPDPAGAGAALAGGLVVFCEGLRIRALILDVGSDLDVEYSAKVAEIAGLFGAYPAIQGVLFMAAGSDLRGVIVDRGDIEKAFEIPTGRLSPPRIWRPIDDAASAVVAFVHEALPRFAAFGRVGSANLEAGVTIDATAITAAVVAAKAVTGKRARIDAKKTSWSGLGEVEVVGIAKLIDECHSKMPEDVYRSRLEAITGTAA